MAEERLQKVLAAAGVASRRACEEIITAGRVKVNGQVVTELGTKVDTDKQTITLDDRRVEITKQHIYLKLHKPRGVLGDSGGEDAEESGRDTIIDLLPEDMKRVFPIGRLDLHSEGLVLLTDDGDLANKLTHPRYHHPKLYFVLIGQRPTESALTQLRTGVDLPEGRSAPAQVRMIEHLPRELRLSAGLNEGCWLEFVLYEGKKRQIRHMTAAVGYPTLRLVRWSIGPVTMGDLRQREHAHLTARELAELRNLVDGTLLAVPPPVRKLVKREHSTRAQDSHSSSKRATARIIKPRLPEDRIVRKQDDDESPPRAKLDENRPAASRSFDERKPKERPNADQAADAQSLGDKPQRPRPSADRSSNNRSFTARPTRAKPSSARPSSNRPYGDRPSRPRSDEDRPARSQSFGDRPSRPRSDEERPSGNGPYGDRAPRPRSDEDRPARSQSFGDRPSRPRSDGDRPSGNGPYGDRRPRARSTDERPSLPRSDGDRPSGNGPYGNRAPRARSNEDRPARPASKDAGNGETKRKPKNSTGNRK